MWKDALSCCLLHGEVAIGIMLQWMGGSRRKVATSRKSAHNRQKQYFEQRKRQRQSPGQDNLDKKVHVSVEPRSLDILNLRNLAASSQQAKGLTASVVDCDASKNSDPSLLGKQDCTNPAVVEKSRMEHVTNSSHNNFTESSQHQDATDSHQCSGFGNRWNLQRSIPECTCRWPDDLFRDKEEEPQIEFSFLDLLGDDDVLSKKPNGRPLPEAHVALSVEGLGTIGTQTPAHSPRLQYRFLGKGLSQESKASMRIHSLQAPKSSQDDLKLKMNAMLGDFSVSPAFDAGGLLDDFGAKTKNGRSDKSSMTPGFHENHVEGISFKGKDFRTDLLASNQNHLNESVGFLKKHFIEKESCAAALHTPRFSLKEYPFLNTNSKKFERSYKIADFGVRDSFLQDSWKLGEDCRISDTSDTSSPCFRHWTTREEAKQSFSWESDVNSTDRMFNQPSWSFPMTEECQNNTSLFSEGSNFSTPVENINSLKKKAKPREKFQMYSREPSCTREVSTDENILTGFDEPYWGTKKQSSFAFESLEPPGNIFLQGQKFPPSEVALTQDPFDMFTTVENGRSSGYKTVPEDDHSDLFHASKSKFEIPVEFEQLSDSIFHQKNCRKKSAFDFHFQTPVKHSSKANSSSPHSWSSRELRKESNFAQPPKCQDDDEDRGSSAKPQPKDCEKGSTSSLNAESESRTDSLSKGIEHNETNGEKADNSLNEAVNIPTAEEEFPSQLEKYVHGKLNEFQVHSPVASHLSNEEKKGQSNGCGHGEASYQVMLQSYVLQLLFVQKVLLEASGKDAKKHMTCNIEAIV
ncbi:hypothetical protein HPP92_015425 [Vanilla planifolia]|uniref:Uncharacterized protein n=1 Tax=Vanilla planifolia TaxID=51239 RepID=A0A835QS39_VANPL|nr:hypothetical protein HPP92_015425 [Vanilla planifolia]